MKFVSPSINACKCAISAANPRVLVPSGAVSLGATARPVVAESSMPESVGFSTSDRAGMVSLCPASLGYCASASSVGGQLRSVDGFSDHAGKGRFGGPLDISVGV